MAEAARETLQLISGLLGHMRQIVGDGACYAMLHYGATEEGKRLGAGSEPADLPRLLERLDLVLLQKSEVVQDEGSTVTIRIRSSGLLEGSSQRAVQGLILGLVEGALTASRSGRFRGAAIPTDDGLLIELKKEASTSPA